MAVKTDLGELVGEVRHRVEAVGDVVPVRRLVERAVDDGEIGNLADHAQAGEPLPLLVVELLARPFERGGGDRVHAVERMGAGGILVVVALDGGAVHGPHALQAGDGIGVVADDIAHADVIGHLLFLRILQHGLEGFQVGVNVTEKSDPHGKIRGKCSGDGWHSGQDCRDETRGSGGSSRETGSSGFMGGGGVWLKTLLSGGIVQRGLKRFQASSHAKKRDSARGSASSGLQGRRRLFAGVPNSWMARAATSS